jgi:hypothetical protein
MTRSRGCGGSFGGNLSGPVTPADSRYPPSRLRSTRCIEMRRRHIILSASRMPVSFLNLKRRRRGKRTFTPLRDLNDATMKKIYLYE